MANVSYTMCYPTDDTDVIREKVRIANMSIGDCKKYQVLVDQMEYCLPRHGRVLNTVSFALDRQKSLAIYGGHHSGKSHALYQLIGDQGINFGELYICRNDTKHKTKDAWREVGFCPQEKGLCDVVHPNQLFTLLFMMQGVPKEDASPKVKDIVKALNLRRYMTKRVSFLPANVKRKLNIALTLIIDNKVLILDEPTEGMPAGDRRQIWNFLKKERCCGSSLIFSSCDSLECEKLADVMIVVDNGEMLAYGSYEYLRAKYTRGVYLEVKLVTDGTTKDEMDDKNRYESILKFYIPIDNVRFSYLFGSVEKNKRRLNISEYSIDMPSFLEAVYNILGTRNLRDQYKTNNRDSIKSQDNSKDQDPHSQDPKSRDNMTAGQGPQRQDPESKKKGTANQDPQSQEPKIMPIMIPDQGPQRQDPESKKKGTANQDPQSQEPKIMPIMIPDQGPDSQDHESKKDVTAGQDPQSQGPPESSKNDTAIQDAQNQDSKIREDVTASQDPQSRYSQSSTNVTDDEDSQSQSLKSSQNLTPVQDPQTQYRKKSTTMKQSQSPLTQDSKSSTEVTEGEDSQSQIPKTLEKVTAIQDTQRQDAKSAENVTAGQDPQSQDSKTRVNVPAIEDQKDSQIQKSIDSTDISKVHKVPDVAAATDANEINTDVWEHSQSFTESQITSEHDSASIQTTELEYDETEVRINRFPQ